MSVISVKGLTKDYGNGKGIFDLDFEIAKGEAFGYLGPNGSGKTTTIRNLLGFLNPDRGQCSINGLDCRKNSEDIQLSLGYLPGEIAFFDEMKGISYLNFIAKMRKMTDFKKMHELIDFFELDVSGRIKKMSKGMKQKIGIVSAFMHSPDVLILDEPTSGLDPLMQSKFIELILKEKSLEKTILISSHSFEEIEKTCDRIGIIKKGHIVDIENINNLKKAQRKAYMLSFATEDEAKRYMQNEKDVEKIYQNNVTVTVSGNLKGFLNVLDKYELTGLDSVTQTLEDVFMAYYGGERGEK